METRWLLRLRPTSRTLWTLTSRTSKASLRLTCCSAVMVPSEMRALMHWAQSQAGIKPSLWHRGAWNLPKNARHVRTRRLGESRDLGSHDSNKWKPGVQICFILKPIPASVLYPSCPPHPLCPREEAPWTSMMASPWGFWGVRDQQEFSLLKPSSRAGNPGRQQGLKLIPSLREAFRSPCRCRPSTKTMGVLVAARVRRFSAPVPSPPHACFPMALGTVPTNKTLSPCLCQQSSAWGKGSI